MIHLSQYQLVRLWSQLEQAYYGDNGYGSDTAEIYAYTLHEHSPSLMHQDATEGGLLYENQQEMYKNAEESLVSVLKWFEKQRNCNILVNGLSISEWKRTIGNFSHRVHVQVITKEGK
jgi:hypothetical protein